MAALKVTRKDAARSSRPTTSVSVEDARARVERIQEELGALRQLTGEEALRSVDAERKRAMLAACDVYLLGAVEQIHKAWHVIRSHLAATREHAERSAA